MMRINAADRAEIMPRGKSIELIKAQGIFAFDDFDSGRGTDAAITAPFATTERAVMMAWVYNTVRQVQLKHYSATVTRSTMLRLNNRISNLFDHCAAPSELMA